MRLKDVLLNIGAIIIIIIILALITVSLSIELGFEYIKANIWSKSIEKVVK